MARARRVSLFERQVRVGLSTAAIDILFDIAALLSEGQLERGQYFGSTMITIDLHRASALVSEACDVATARRVGELVADDERVRARARDLGLAEAERHAGCRLQTPRIDVRLRCTGSHLHLDLDIDAKASEANES